MGCSSDADEDSGKGAGKRLRVKDFWDGRGGDFFVIFVAE